ncbi:MAG TPA: FHA domain-containing protein [Tepidisphaeraceae bacterium]|nr:FHA domain-containing protein [Tepidisphaeraceae bacterium]
MATLLMELGSHRRAGQLSGRVLIGSLPINTIRVEDSVVAKVHAWIGRDRGGFYVADAGSRTGTFVNGQRVSAHQALRDGDEIRVGPLRLWISSNLAAPPDAELIDLTPRPLEGTEIQGGLFHECRCGAPIWVPAGFDLRSGQCRFCGRPMAGDAPKGEPSSDTKTPTALETCAICQSPMTQGEATHVCPSCGLVFHEECWKENRGCAAYGCAQVGITEE